MSEPKTQPTDASVEDFLAAVEPARRREEGRMLCVCVAGWDEMKRRHP